LLFSLVECLWILPAHLSHIGGRNGSERAGLWHRFQGRVATQLDRFIARVYSPALESCLSWRYLTVSVGIAVLLLTTGVVGAGWVRFIFFPAPEADSISVSLTMPQGTPVEVTSSE
jgi:multidrug efflux pump subunit AcrB